MRTLLVTGARGQLGSDLVRNLAGEYEVVPADIAEFDIANLEATLKYVGHVRPDVLIHCAAFAAVDACETEQARAYLINAVGTRNVSVAARKVHAQLVYFSTDYVFDGEKPGPYCEHDQPNPLTVYGKSKLMGETFVAQQVHAHFILRIAWLYGHRGSNFVKTILRLARTDHELRVVHDQSGTPTWTVDVARQLRQLLETEAYGTYHATAQGSCSWFEFAKAILEEANLDVPVVPVTTGEFSRPAPRPKNSVLDNLLLRIQGLDRMPPWRDSLSQFMAQTRYEEEEGA